MNTDRDRSADSIWLGQPSYTENILQQFNMQDAKLQRTPLNPSLKLIEADENSILVNTELYQSAVGKLLYLSTRTRPDIAFAVSTVAKFTAKPTEQHWKAVKHILRYLVGTVDYGLQFTKDGMTECVGYTDADWAGDVDDRKSTSGYLFKIGGASVSWMSRKQSCVALSTAEAEYISLTHAAQEAIWLNRLLAELKGIKEPPKPALIHEDNQSAISMSRNPQFHGRSKHIAIKYHFIRDETKNGTIDVHYCRSEDMIADMMTKGLYAERFEKLRDMTGVKKMSSEKD